MTPPKIKVNKSFSKQVRQVAIRAALEAGNMLIKRCHAPNFSPTTKTVGYKGAINLVTDADTRSEELIVRLISRNFPDHSICAEEREPTASDSEYRWLIDPLDGTTNYAHGLPIWCISIGLEQSGEMIFGLVYNPNLSEMYMAEKDKGATLNNVRIRVSTTRSLDKSLLATGFPYDIRESKVNNLEFFRRFALRARAVRRCGSAALDLCYLAAGRFDGFWELKLAPWDQAAGSLIVAEAGGTLSDFSGGRFSVELREIVASNGKIHNEMLRVLNKKHGVFWTNDG